MKHPLTFLAALLLAPLAAHAQQAAPTTVRDHLWLFGCPPNADAGYLENAGYRGGSRMTPVEGAFWLGVPNLLFITQDYNRPKAMWFESKWKAKTTMEQWAIAFEPLKRVNWAAVGSSGGGGLNTVPDIVTLAKEYPNFTGIYLESMKHFDVLVLWTWKSAELKDLEKNLALLESIKPKTTRIALGIYLWDYTGVDEAKKVDPTYRWGKPVPLDLMAHQCSLGLKWLKEGHVCDLVILGNTHLDLGINTAPWMRDWIREHGDERFALDGKRPSSFVPHFPSNPLKISLFPLFPSV